MFITLACIPGIILLWITQYLKKQRKSFVIRFIPACLSIIVSSVLLYISIAKIHGFEGAVYSIWSLFMMAFTLAAVFIAKSDYRRI